MSDDRFFSGFEPPPPPPGLREAALRAGRAAFAGAPRADVWSRLAGSRLARVAWAASVAALAAAHVFLPARPRPAPQAPVAGPDREVGAIARLPRIDERALPMREGGPS